MKTPPPRVALIALVSAFALAVLIPPPALRAQESDDKTEKAVKKKGFRTFTGKNGKALDLRVVTRIDDDRYTFEDPEGKTFTLNVKEKLSQADQSYLELWEPDAILDIVSADLSEVLAKRNYSGTDITAANNLSMVTAKLGGKESKCIIDPGRHCSTLDPAAAKDLGLTLRQGTVTFNGPGGQARSEQGTVESFALADLEVKSVTFEVFNVAGLFGSVPAGTAGSIGSNLLKQLNAIVDHGAKRIYVRGDE